MMNVLLIQSENMANLVKVIGCDSNEGVY